MTTAPWWDTQLMDTYSKSIYYVDAHKLEPISTHPVALRYIDMHIPECIPRKEDYMIKYSLLAIYQLGRIQINLQNRQADQNFLDNQPACG